jgi:hypothetical protein
MAVGRLMIARLSVHHTKLGHVKIRELDVGSLRVEELDIVKRTDENHRRETSM